MSESQCALSTSRPARVLVVDDSPTILGLVRRILERHGHTAVLAHDGVEGLDQLARSGPFDLVLLDFVMPRMNGYQFCRELRARPEHAKLPVVLMSARSDTIGERFVEQTGAVDALGKPFDALAVAAVVSGVMEKAAKGEADRQRPEPAEMADEGELDRGPESMAPPSRQLGTAHALAARLAEAIGPAIRRLTARDLSRPDALNDAIVLSLDDHTLQAMAEILEETREAAARNVVLRGALSGIPLAELLQMLQLLHQTGVLRVRHKDRSMTLSVRDGMIDLVESHGTDEEFRIGRYFIEQEWIWRDQLEELAAKARQQNKLLGEMLLVEGRITEDQLRKALAKQSCELVYELLRWPKGKFTFSEEAFPDTAQKAELGLGISNLILEGYRRVDEWRQMENVIDFDSTLVVDTLVLDSITQSDFGLAEHRVLEAIDGRRTVREVVSATELTSFDAVRTIYRLLQSRIVRARSKAGVTNRPPPLPDAT